MIAQRFGSPQSEGEFFRILKSFQQDQITAPLQECGDLFTENHCPIDLPVRGLIRRKANGSDASGDPAGGVRVVNDLSRKQGRLTVDFAGERFHAKGGKFQRVGPEGVRRDQTRSCGKVLSVNPGNQFRLREAKLLIAVSRRNPPLGEKRTHGSVTAENALLQRIKKIAHDFGLVESGQLRRVRLATSETLMTNVRAPKRAVTARHERYWGGRQQVP